MVAVPLFRSTCLRMTYTIFLLILFLAVTVGLEIGDEVETEGYIMDYYCIQRGTLLDRSSVRTLEGPEKHSLHCLVDVSSCYTSPFEILLPPLENETEYRRGFRVDPEGQAELIRLGRQVGDDCSTCDGSGSQTHGFYAMVNGTVIDLGSDDVPPTLDVSGIEVAMGSETSETHSLVNIGVFLQVLATLTILF